MFYITFGSNIIICSTNQIAMRLFNFILMKKNSISKKILLTLGCLPLLVNLSVRFIFGQKACYIFRDNMIGYIVLALTLVLYIVVCVNLSKRTRKCYFTSNQQLLHNRLLFSIVYPFVYIWIIEDILAEEKDRKS